MTQRDKRPMTTATQGLERAPIAAPQPGDLEPAMQALEALYQRAQAHVLGLVSRDGRISSRLLEQHQLAAHALAFFATELEAARQLRAWSGRVGGELERRIAGAYVTLTTI